MKTNEVIQKFLNNLTGIRRFSANTLKSYRRDLEDFADFCSQRDRQEIGTIDTRFIKLFLVSLGEKNLKDSSVARKLSALRAFFAFTFRNGFISSNPAAALKNPKVKRSLPETISKENYHEIITEIEREEKPSKTYPPILIKAVFELLYGCSLRVSEVCGLRYSDLDKGSKRIRVLGKGNKIRYVPIGKSSLEVLHTYLITFPPERGSDYLLRNAKGKPLYSDMLFRLVRKYVGKVSEIKKKGPHSLRHSSATHMLDSGADITAIKEILGHESLSTTQIYTHVSIEQLKNIYKKSHPKS